jgi:two-component sensor histidine kinase/PAS domain-containing protein
MIVLWGTDLIQIYNDAYARICVDKHPAALGQPTRECWPEVWQFNAPIYDAVFRGEACSFEAQKLSIMRHGISEDAFFDLNYSAVRDESGSVAGVLVTVVEVTGRMWAEEALRAGEERWRGVFEHMHEGLAVCEMVYDQVGAASDFRYLEVNAAWERLTGIPPAAVVGHLASKAIPGIEPFWAETFARVVETGKPARFEYPLAVLDRLFEVHAYRTEPRRFAALFLNITERRRSEERQALLSREVDHRAKNALAVVQAALRLTKAPDLPSYMKAIEGRVAALARAQTLLADDRWAGADLRLLLRGELAIFIDAGSEAGQQTELVGPSVTLPAGAAQPLAMAFHELATNALKYGALSTSTGRVVISWRLDAEPGERLRLRWTETGGPTVERPAMRRGFGARVLDGTIRGQLSGTVSLAWEPAGLVCDIEVPLKRSTAAAQTPLTGDR